MDRPPEQQAACVRAAGFAIRCQRFAFRVEVVTPKNARQRLRNKHLTFLFIEQVDCGSGVDLGVFPRRPSLLEVC